MSMIDPIQDDGDTVLATENQRGDDGMADQKTAAKEMDLPLVELRGSQGKRPKLSPTVQYDTDRYRLARPFTTRL